MIEIIVFLALLFLVFVFFYKQSSSEFNILQIEASNLSTLSELLEESSPIVIRGLGPPTLLTPETLRTNSRIQTFPVSDDISLSKWLEAPPSHKKYANSLQKKLVFLCGQTIRGFLHSRNPRGSLLSKASNHKFS
jgi:hypothetical protein